MSSHHFVREEQEPALLIEDPEAAPLDVVHQLLEWSPTVVVFEKALPSVLSWGIKIDVVVALEENCKQLALALQDQTPLKFISCAADEYMNTALYFLLASKQHAVNVLSHKKLESFEHYPLLDITVHQHGKKWSFIRSGVFEKWYPKGVEIVSYLKSSADKIVTESEGMMTIRRGESFWVGE